MSLSAVSSALSLVLSVSSRRLPQRGVGWAPPARWLGPPLRGQAASVVSERVLSAVGYVRAWGPCTSIVCVHGTSQSILPTVAFSAEYLANLILLDPGLQTERAAGLTAGPCLTSLAHAALSPAVTCFDGLSLEARRRGDFMSMGYTLPLSLAMLKRTGNAYSQLP